MRLCLDTIRGCLEDHVPPIIATVDAEGMPNVALISQAIYVDESRIALSYQFFNKTRRNLIATTMASIHLTHPFTGERIRLDLDFEETRTHGPVFEAMKARLAGIASHSGMQGVFHLLGSDIFRVRSIVRLDAPALSPPARRPLLPAVGRACHALSRARNLETAFDAVMEAVADDFGVQHTMLLVLDREERSLYTVASRGYPVSGVGSEIGLGEGIIGVAAREGVPIRIGHMSAEYSYSGAILGRARDSGLALLNVREIPYPGLEAPESQMALPIRSCDRTLGVLFLESHEPLQFLNADEEALGIIARHLGSVMTLFEREEATHFPYSEAPAPVDGKPVQVRHYAFDNSIFLDSAYLIKGVAGAILWRLLCENKATGRTEFTNREVRLDPILRLPEHSENLEARLVLLTRRLAERSSNLRIERCGRGRFRLAMSAPVALESVEQNENVPVA